MPKGQISQINVKFLKINTVINLYNRKIFEKFVKIFFPLSRTCLNISTCKKKFVAKNVCKSVVISNSGHIPNVERLLTIIVFT